MVRNNKKETARFSSQTSLLLYFAIAALKKDLRGGGGERGEVILKGVTEADLFLREDCQRRLNKWKKKLE